MQTQPGNRRTLFIQITVVSIICIIVAALAVIFIPQTANPDQRRVTLRVESSSGSVTIQYEAGQNIQKDPEKTFNTPWERTYVLPTGTEVYLTAGNYQQQGSLKCSIRLDGRSWKEETAKMPVDRVACAGIVR